MIERGPHDEQGWATTIEGLSEVKKFFVGKGADVGCGTAPANPGLATPVDKNPDASSAEIIHDCSNLECFEPNSLDFIFSSHCLEDFEDIPSVAREWWTRLKVGGVMILLLPDMEGGRYPTVESGGNPSHRTNVGPVYMTNLFSEFSGTVLQYDTVPHHSSTFDFVIRRDA